MNRIFGRSTRGQEPSRTPAGGTPRQRQRGFLRALRARGNARRNEEPRPPEQVDIECGADGDYVESQLTQTQALAFDDAEHVSNRDSKRDSGHRPDSSQSTRDQKPPHKKGRADGGEDQEEELAASNANETGDEGKKTPPAGSPRNEEEKSSEGRDDEGKSTVDGTPNFFARSNDELGDDRKEPPQKGEEKSDEDIDDEDKPAGDGGGIDSPNLTSEKENGEQGEVEPDDHLTKGERVMITYASPDGTNCYPATIITYLDESSVVIHWDTYKKGNNEIVARDRIIGFIRERSLHVGEKIWRYWANDGGWFEGEITEAGDGGYKIKYEEDNYIEPLGGGKALYLSCIPTPWSEGAGKYYQKQTQHDDSPKSPTESKATEESPAPKTPTESKSSETLPRESPTLKSSEASPPDPHPKSAEAHPPAQEGTPPPAENKVVTSVEQARNVARDGTMEGEAMQVQPAEDQVQPDEDDSTNTGFDMQDLTEMCKKVEKFILERPEPLQPLYEKILWSGKDNEGVMGKLADAKDLKEMLKEYNEAKGKVLAGAMRNTMQALDTVDTEQKKADILRKLLMFAQDHGLVM